MQLNIVNQVLHQNAKLQKVRVSKKTLQIRIDQILKILSRKKLRNKKRLKAAELILVFLSAKEIKKINLKYRAKNKPTDVLSFVVSDPDCLGEIVLCPEVLLRQSKEYGHSYDQEMLTMLIHGILHLLGYDHERSKAEDRLMLALQSSVLDSILTKPAN